MAWKDRRLADLLLRVTAKRRDRKAALRKTIKRETFEAVASNYRGKVWSKVGPTWKGLMADADHELKLGPGRDVRVSIRGEYTSDGSYWKNHGGRVVAAFESGRWMVY